MTDPVSQRYAADCLRRFGDDHQSGLIRSPSVLDAENVICPCAILQLQCHLERIAAEFSLADAASAVVGEVTLLLVSC